MKYLDLAVRQNQAFNSSDELSHQSTGFYLGKRLRRSFSNESIPTSKFMKYYRTRKRVLSLSDDFSSCKISKASYNKRCRNYLTLENQEKVIKLEGFSNLSEARKMPFTKSDLLKISILLEEYKIDWKKLASELGLESEEIISLDNIEILKSPCIHYLSILSTWNCNSTTEKSSEWVTMHSLKTAICNSSDDSNERNIKQLLEKLDSL